MFLRVMVLVFLFLARLRFPSTESLPSIVRRRYGSNILKLVRKFEKIDYKLRKAELDICFLHRCDVNDVIPKFLQFRLANKNLRNSVAYKNSQKQLLHAEIHSKESHLSSLKNQFNHSRSELQSLLNVIDFAHISSIFLASNDSTLKNHDTVQQRKFQELLLNKKPANDPNKVISNFT